MKGGKWHFREGEVCDLCSNEARVSAIAGVRIGAKCLRLVEEIAHGDLSVPPKKPPRRLVKLGPKRKPGRPRKDVAAA